jgi:asparagine synthase (glutamine-hydrolysing)
MCGIAGIVRFGSDGDAARAATMRDRLRHRGPDGDGVFAARHVALAHTRLALLDPAGGAQPMCSPDGRYTLVYNGEVYNLDELRAALSPDWRFATRSDAEVVLAAHAAWGADCARRLDGMFAFFVWDSVAERGFAARDLLGVKPFVYAWDGGELRFASEAKALVADVPRAAREALVEYLVAPALSGVARPLFDGLAYLPPGYALTIDAHGLSTARWGAHPVAGPFENVSASELRTALAASVAGACTADVSVGVFLSGGLDSTLLAALAGPRPALTVRFASADLFDYSRSLIVRSDDTPFATRAATELGLSQTLVESTTSAADLAVLARHDDALPAWEQELAQHVLARAAAQQGLKAVVVGDAADETHFGYDFLLDEAATASPGRIVERFYTPLVRAEVLARPVEHFDDHYRSLTVDAGCSWATPRDRTLATTWLIQARWLSRLLHNGDIHTMAFSVEARVPFACRRVLEVAARVAPEVGLAGGVEKALLREAAEGLVPSEIARRKKSALPKDQTTAQLYQREAARAVDECGDLLSAVVDVDIVRKLAAANSLDEKQRAGLFRVICLAHWARAYNVRL